MMKYGAFLLFALFLTTTSCKQFSDHSHMEQMSQMKDSIFKAYPSVGAVTIKVEDRRMLIITLGSKKLAGGTAAERQKLATELGAMALRLFGRDNSIEQEKLIITPNERNDVAEPADGKSTVVSLDSLRKAINRDGKGA